MRNVGGRAKAGMAAVGGPEVLSWVEGGKVAVLGGLLVEVGRLTRRTGLCQVVFRYALALLKYKEAELMRLHDTSDIYHFLRFFPRTVIDSR